MDAIIRNYRVRIEETGLVLTHPVGISFDLTLDEAVGLMEIIKVYQDAIVAAKRDIEPRIEWVVVDENTSATECVEKNSIKGLFGNCGRMWIEQEKARRQKRTNGTKLTMGGQ